MEQLGCPSWESFGRWRRPGEGAVFVLSFFFFFKFFFLTFHFFKFLLLAICPFCPLINTLFFLN